MKKCTNRVAMCLWDPRTVHKAKVSGSYFTFLVTDFKEICGVYGEKNSLTNPNNCALNREEEEVHK
ncbi:unnamed protein product [Brassica oleracea]